MREKFRKFLIPVGGLVVAATLLGWFATQKQSSGNALKTLELGVWYWHSPLSLSTEETKALKEHGLNKLFVRAGTFSTDGKNAVLVIPQSYRQVPDLETHMVFNFDGGFIRHFEEFDLATIAGQIASRIQNQTERTQKLGLEVKGIQLDLDCPTRLLPRYAELIKEIRKQVPGNLKWSTTGLMSWLGTPGVETLSAELDFIVPQAYEGVTGKTVDTMRPVADHDYLKAVLPRAERLKCPYYIGVPAYGHGFLFDEKGKLVDIYQRTGPAESMVHPSFKFQEAFAADRKGQPAKTSADSVGEQIIKLKAIRPSPTGRGLNYTLGYSIPAPEVLQESLRIVREHSGPKCLGAIIYRYPEPRSTLTLSTEGFLATVKGERIIPQLSVTTNSIQDTFDLIEGGAKTANAPTDFFVTVNNPSAAATFVSPDAVEVVLEFSKTGIEDVRLRDFEDTEFGVLDRQGAFQPTARSKANAVRLRKSYLGSKQRASAGPIRLFEPGAEVINIKWTLRNANGFDKHQGSEAPPSESSRKPLK